MGVCAGGRGVHFAGGDTDRSVCVCLPEILHSQENQIREFFSSFLFSITILLTHSLTYPLTHSLTHSLTHTIHSLTHSLTHTLALSHILVQEDTMMLERMRMNGDYLPPAYIPVCPHALKDCTMIIGYVYT